MQIFYDPADGQVMAVYTNRYGGNHWQSLGYLSAESSVRLTRDHKVTVVDGVVTSYSDSQNPVQPDPPPPGNEVAFEDQVLEALRVLQARADINVVIRPGR